MIDEQIIKRNDCISCGGNVEDVYTLKDFPVFMGVTSNAREKDKSCDKIIGSCSKCNCVQMKNLIPLEILYENNHNSLVGTTWEKHHNQFCDFVREYVKGTVVEIGGSNLVVANNLSKVDKVTEYIVFDNNIYKEDRTSDKIVFSSY